VASWTLVKKRPFGDKYPSTGTGSSKQDWISHGLDTNAGVFQIANDMSDSMINLINPKEPLIQLGSITYHH
jgi:hypothetical protein